MVGSWGRGVKKYSLAGSARVWILSGMLYEKVEFCCRTSSLKVFRRDDTVFAWNKT